MNKKYFVVLQIETNEDINDVVGFILDHGAQEFPVEVLQVEEADEAALKVDGPPTLMYP